MSDELAAKSCVPCSGGVPALKGAELQTLSSQLPAWEVVEEHHLRRIYSFPDFKSALARVNAIGEVAEAEGHHPDVSFTWGRVTVEVFTHAIDGLTESDFVLAAKIERLT
ncbi:MAG: 4a-hydroxytetrahydrobiopterin dehydratase [Myxococcota bacterium]